MAKTTKRVKILTEKQEKFCREYLLCGNAAEAYTRAYNRKSPRQCSSLASTLVSQDFIQDRLYEIKHEATKEFVVTIGEVLKNWSDIAFADPSEIIRVKTFCCRHCWGKDFKYQYTPNEYRETCENARLLKKPEPDTAGGIDFWGVKDPNLNCPECFGMGVKRIDYTDTKLLTGRAKILYAGVKYGKSGIEIQLRNQDEALTNIAKYLGMFLDKKPTKADEDKPPLMLTVNDPIEAAKIYQKIMTGT